MMIDLPYINRLSEPDRVSGRTPPWEFEVTETITDVLRKDKTERMNWANNPQTEHCFFSGYLGLNPDGRISTLTENPASQMLAIVVDYDGEQTMDRFKKMLDKHDCPYYPNYLSHSLGGGIHAVWVLETPVNIDERMIKPLMTEVMNTLRLAKLAKGLDKPALFAPEKYFTVGDGWTQVNSTPVPEIAMNYWVKEALQTESLRLGSESSINIPLDLAYEEAKKIYGDKMHDIDCFEMGMRCRRFWDETATKTAGAFLMNNGFFCHAGNETFKDWQALLGFKFVEQYKESQYDGVTKDTYYDGSGYIYLNEANNEWTPQKTTEMALRLNVDFRMSKAPPKRGLPSEVDEVMRQIQKNRTVEAYTKFIHRPEGVLTFQGKKYVNISQVRAMNPSGKYGEWGEWFPFLSTFFDNFLSSDHEKNLLLAWWKRAYEGALALDPERGHIMLIAGPTDCGKTLFNDRMLAPSLGGGVDAAEFYVDGSSFNDTFYEVGLHKVDDAAPGSKPGARASMAARLKKSAAAASVSLNGKFKDVKQVEWIGRVCITMNNDAESLKATPELQVTLKDKLIAVQANRNALLPTMPRKEIEALITDELPHFLEWLTRWEVPEEVTGTSRYGIKPYCNFNIRDQMESGNLEELFLERLDMYLTEYRASAEGKEADGLDIQTSALLENMQSCELIKNGMRGMNAQHLGHILHKCAARGYPFSKKKTKGVMRWTIPYDYREEKAEDE